MVQPPHKSLSWDRLWRGRLPSREIELQSHERSWGRFDFVTSFTTLFLEGNIRPEPSLGTLRALTFPTRAAVKGSVFIKPRPSLLCLMFARLVSPRVSFSQVRYLLLSACRSLFCCLVSIVLTSQSRSFAKKASSKDGQLNVEFQVCVSCCT